MRNAGALVASLVVGLVAGTARGQDLDGETEKALAELCAGSAKAIAALAATKAPAATVKALAALVQGDDHALHGRATLALAALAAKQPKGLELPLDAVTAVLAHPDCRCEQGGAELVRAFLGSGGTPSKEVAARLAEALIPVASSQRPEVYGPATSALEKLSGGEKHGRDAIAWAKWFEGTHGRRVDVDCHFHEVLAVVDVRGSRIAVNGEPVPDRRAATVRVRELRLDLPGVTFVGAVAAGPETTQAEIEERATILFDAGLTGTTSVVRGDGHAPPALAVARLRGEAVEALARCRRNGEALVARLAAALDGEREAPEVQEMRKQIEALAGEMLAAGHPRWLSDVEKLRKAAAQTSLERPHGKRLRVSAIAFDPRPGKSRAIVHLGRSVHAYGEGETLKGEDDAAVRGLKVVRIERGSVTISDAGAEVVLAPSAGD